MSKKLDKGNHYVLELTRNNESNYESKDFEFNDC